MTHSKGGAADVDLGSEGSVELTALSECTPSGVRGVLGEDPTPAVAVPSPGPIYVTILDPTAVSSGTFAVPYGQALTITNGSTISVTAGPAFPAVR